MASFRIANLLVNEDGPFLVFEHLRNFVGLKPGKVSGFFPLLFSCIWCMSVWTTISVYFVYVLEPRVVIILAGMTLALAANSFINKE